MTIVFKKEDLMTDIFLQGRKYQEQDKDQELIKALIEFYTYQNNKPRIEDKDGYIYIYI